MKPNGEDHFDIREDVMALLTAIDLIDEKPPPVEKKRILELMSLMLKRINVAVEDELRK